MSTISNADRQMAHEAVDYLTREPDTDGEILCVLDALCNNEDPTEALQEYRYWRTISGRNDEREGAGGW